MGPGGFRVTGAGGLANIASILGASGLSFRRADENDYDGDDNGGSGSGGIIVYDDDDKNESEEGDDGKFENVDSTEGSSGQPEGYVDDKALRDDLKPQDVTDQLVRRTKYLYLAHVHADGTIAR